MKQEQQKKRLEVRHCNIKQEIENFIPPPHTWYRDIGGKHSHIEIVVGLNANSPLEQGERIDLRLSCHYGSGFFEEIHSEKPIFTILENLSRLKIDDAGSAIISLRFEQLSTRHCNEVNLSDLKVSQFVSRNLSCELLQKEELT
jgi:hypothetical protein